MTHRVQVRSVHVSETKQSANGDMLQGTVRLAVSSHEAAVVEIEIPFSKQSGLDAAVHVALQTFQIWANEAADAAGEAWRKIERSLADRSP